MRRMGMAIAALAVALTAGAGRAGVYDLDDPLPPRYPPLPTNHDQIRLVLAPLRAAGVPRLPNQPRSLYEMQAAALEQKTPGAWTTTDRIDLGACYLRMNRPNDAIRVLSDADQKNPFVLANLAVAYQGINELRGAVEKEKDALAAWPSVQPGWNEGQLAWYRRAEGYYLKLLKSRLDEPKPAKGMDPLFGAPARPGDYEAEIQPWRLWDDLPPDAYEIVSQLLLWSPYDDRLYWQLGELLNCQGYVEDAVKVFEDISFAGTISDREFRSHRSTLKAAAPEAAALISAVQNDPSKFQTDLNTLLWALSPRGMLLPPVGGDLANEAALAARAPIYEALRKQQEQLLLRQLRQQLQQLDPQSQQQAAAPAPPPSGNSWPDWRPMLVGFAAGLIVAGLAALQLTEWRRRRQTAALPSPDAPRSPRKESAAHDAGAIRTDAPTAPDRMEGAP